MGTMPIRRTRHEQASQKRHRAPHRRESPRALRLLHRRAASRPVSCSRVGKSNRCAPARRSWPRPTSTSRTARLSCSARTSRRSTRPRRTSWPTRCAPANYCSSKAELSRLVGTVERKGYTLVPLDLHWKQGPRQARARARQGQEAARQACHRKGPRLGARQGAHTASGLIQRRLAAPIHDLGGLAGLSRQPHVCCAALLRGRPVSTWVANRERRTEGVRPSLNNFANHSCQRRQLRSSCLIAADPQTSWCLCR